MCPCVLVILNTDDGRASLSSAAFITYAGYAIRDRLIKTAQKHGLVAMPNHCSSDELRELSGNGDVLQGAANVIAREFATPDDAKEAKE